MLLLKKNIEKMIEIASLIIIDRDIDFQLRKKIYLKLIVNLLN